MVQHSDVTTSQIEIETLTPLQRLCFAKESCFIQDYTPQPLSQGCPVSNSQWVQVYKGSLAPVCQAISDPESNCWRLCCDLIAAQFSSLPNLVFFILQACWLEGHSPVNFLHTSSFSWCLLPRVTHLQHLASACTTQPIGPLVSHWKIKEAG